MTLTAVPSRAAAAIGLAAVVVVDIRSCPCSWSSLLAWVAVGMLHLTMPSHGGAQAVFDGGA